MRTVALWLSTILIFMIPWEAIIVLPGLGTVARITGLVVAAFWAFTVVVTGEFRKPRLFHLAAYAFILWNVISSFWTVNLDDTSMRLKTYAQLFGLSLIVWDLYTTPAALKMGLQAYVLGAYVSVASTVNNYFAGRAYSNYTDRFGLTGFDVNELGVILALGIPVAWHLALSESYSKKTHFLKLINYAYIPAALLAISLTASRGSLVAVLPAFWFILGSSRRLKLFPRIVILVMLAVGLFASQSLVPRSSIDRLFTTGTSIATGDISGRGRIWREGVEVFLEHPLLGVGSGGFRQAVESGLAPHNAFLSVLVDLGIIGFVLFAIILTTTVYQAVQQLKWESRFWLTVLMVLALGSSSLGIEAKKMSWLFPSLVIVSANLPIQHVRSRLRPEFPYAKAVRISPGSPLPVQGSQTEANHNLTSLRTIRKREV